jgi:hypothetical protein
MIGVELDKRFIGPHPGKPFYMDPFQELLLFPNPGLSENEDLMPPFLQFLDEIDKKRRLNNVRRMNGKRRSDDTNVHGTD